MEQEKVAAEAVPGFLRRAAALLLSQADGHIAAAAEEEVSIALAPAALSTPVRILERFLEQDRQRRFRVLPDQVCRGGFVAEGH